jgi:dephospho-CoA kinase
MFIIGITGGIGCGKSTVADLCRRAGQPHNESVEVYRTVTAAGGSAMPAVVSQFGEDILRPDGGLDREKMAGKVFADRRVLDKLSRIVHAEVIAEMNRQVETLRQKKVKVVVLDVPIPVKQGFLDICDQVWVVWADDPIRIDRLRGRGMGEEEARRRMAMQMTFAEYSALADQVILNNADYPELVRAVNKLLQKELGDRGIRFQTLEAGL